jgi:hypothetical protein
VKHDYLLPFFGTLPFQLSLEVVTLPLAFANDEKKGGEHVAPPSV